MASLWFTWTFDARTAGMGAFQNERPKDTTHMPSPRRDPSVCTVAGPEMSRAGSGRTKASPVLCRAGPALTKTDPATDDPLRPSPALPRTDPVMVGDDLESPRAGSRTPRTSSATTWTDPSMTTVTVRNTVAVMKMGPAAHRDDPTAAVDNNSWVMAGGDAVTDLVSDKTDPVTDRTDIFTEKTNATKGSSQRTTTNSADVISEAVLFLGLLRHNEDQLVERTKQLLKRDRQTGKTMFSTLVEEWTPLHACTLRGARKLVKMALRCGVSPDLEMGEPDGLPGRCSPLHLAAYRGDVSLLQVLVQGGATVSKRDATRRTPLFYALSNGNTLAARKLIKYGADLSDLTPEQRAFYKEDIERRPASFLCIPVQAGHNDN